MKSQHRTSHNHHCHILNNCHRTHREIESRSEASAFDLALIQYALHYADRVLDVKIPNHRKKTELEIHSIFL